MRTPHERLQAFLYILVRDHLPIGVIDGILGSLRLRDLSDHEDQFTRKPMVKALASDWADRLIGKEEVEPKYWFGLFNEDGSKIGCVSYETKEHAELANPPGAHIRRGRVVGMTTTVANEIDWEAEPYAQ